MKREELGCALLVGLPGLVLVGPFVVSGPWGYMQMAVAALSPALLTWLLLRVDGRGRR